MQRRQFLQTTAAASVLSAGLPISLSAQDKKPNIIFIMTDDLGYGDLSCFGQQKFTTPYLDQLAAEGMKFTQFYSGSTVCAPARCSLMTGLHTGHCYIRGNKEIQPEGQHPLKADTVTVARLMKQAGYTTGCIGKWGLGGPGSEGAPNQQGFDHFFGYLCQRQAHTFYPTHLWRNDEKVELNNEHYSHDMMTDEVLGFIKDNQDDPFFLYLPFTIPHAEMKAPDDALEPFKGRFEEEPFGGRGNYGAQDSPRAAFAGMVTRMDEHVGKIMALLKELNLEEDTLVIFTSDNGPHREGGHDPDYFDSNGPLKGIKRDLYEGGIRVPTIARWTGKIEAGSTSDHTGAFWDMLPTFAELGGADVPENLDGISMAPVLSGKADQQKKHDHLYWEFHEQGGRQAVRKGKWKAVRNGWKNPIELYNLEDDLGEEKNLASQHKDIVMMMETLMKESRTESEVFPVKM